MSVDELVYTVLVSGLVTTVVMFLILPVLQRHALDYPNARSGHAKPIPRGGGVAVIAGLVVGCLTAGTGRSAPVTTILAISVLLGLLGFVDDLRGLRVDVRLGAQFLICVLGAFLIVGTAWNPAVVFAVFSAVFLVGYTNAFNFMDGVNGISAFSAIVGAIWYAAVAYSIGEGSLVVASVAFMAATAAFIPWNYPRARVFLGDIGSYSIGIGLACISLALWSKGADVGAAIAPLVIYIFDTGVTLVVRIAKRKPWREPHRDHVYQRLIDSGVDGSKVSLIVSGFSIAACVSWSLTEQISEILALMALLIVALIYIGLPHLRQRRIGGRI